MWWHRPRATVSRFAPLATALALAGLLGGCFEPLYGEKTLAGGPGLSQRLRAVAIDPIRAASGTPSFDDLRGANAPWIAKKKAQRPDDRCAIPPSGEERT